MKMRPHKIHRAKYNDVRILRLTGAICIEDLPWSIGIPVDMQSGIQTVDKHAKSILSDAGYITQTEFVAHNQN